MEKIRFAIIGGGGWRAQFFLRAARALPEHFEVTGALVRSREKGEALRAAWGVPVYDDLAALLATKPAFVVVSITRGQAASMLETLFPLHVPILCETPPADTVPELQALWASAVRHGAHVQFAEQYFLQPLYMAWERVIREGLLGEVSNINISALHGYHGVSVIRRFLGVGHEACDIHGKKYTFSMVDTMDRDGPVESGAVIAYPRKRATMEFESGKVAFFDFAPRAQYHSFLRTRQLTVQGTHGEIDDLEIRYLTPEGDRPVRVPLVRTDLGVYTNQEWSPYEITMGERLLYRSPFYGARLNDDELAVATCLQRMHAYTQGGEPLYALSDALQDAYLSILMEEAFAAPLTVLRTQPQPWQAAER